MAAQALVIGMLGTATTFGPLIADVSHWFKKRRGIAVAIVASGSYVAGTIWPPILQHAIDAWGWRQTYVGVGIFCVLTMLPLALCLRRRAQVDDGTVPMSARDMADTLRMSPATLQVLLVIAGLACCIAMSMPQVHIVAYCADLGYGPARGAEMLSLMLGFGVVSRLASGLIADRIGGLGTLLLGSSLQCLALLFYLPFDGLTPLYIVSALFGLSQGGIVPSYALIVRDYFPAREAGARVSLVLMATIVGMARGRLAVGRDLRPHRLLRGRVPERHRLEPCSTCRSRSGCCSGAFARAVWRLEIGRLTAWPIGAAPIGSVSRCSKACTAAFRVGNLRSSMAGSRCATQLGLKARLSESRARAMPSVMSRAASSLRSSSRRCRAVASIQLTGLASTTTHCHRRLGAPDRRAQALAEIVDVEEHEIGLEAVEQEARHGARLGIVGDAVKATQAGHATQHGILWPRCDHQQPGKRQRYREHDAGQHAQHQHAERRAEREQPLAPAHPGEIAQPRDVEQAERRDEDDRGQGGGRHQRERRLEKHQGEEHGRGRDDADELALAADRVVDRRARVRARDGEALGQPRCEIAGAERDQLLVRRRSRSGCGARSSWRSACRSRS